LISASGSPDILATFSIGEIDSNGFGKTVFLKSFVKKSIEDIFPHRFTTGE
jgi:hypothetical protein